MKRKLALMLLCTVMTLSAWAQSVINGTVVSATDGEPIIGATVKVKGASQGTVTDVEGKFAINVKAGDHLVVSYIGMQTVEAPAKNNMLVKLGSDETMLDEVMVVAFGSAKKSAFTGSAKVVGSEEIGKAQVTNVTSALAGAVAGVTLTQSNGGPGSSPSIRIRGFSSLNAGLEPLIIVDGAPFSGDMNNINPNDVESMTVLKDAASAALYGARGANGVVIITTKKAKAGQDAQITFDAKWGGNTMALQHYDVITDPAQHYEQHYEALKNFYMWDKGQSAEDAWRSANGIITGRPDQGGLGYDIWTYPEGQYLIGANGRLNPNATLGKVVNYRGQEYLITPDDWEEVGTRTGVRQEYNFSANASTDKSNFYASVGYLKNEGITSKSDFSRLSARLRADYQAKKWLKIGGNLSFAKFDSNYLGNNGNSTSTGNIWAFTSQIAPIYPAYVRNADGSIMVDANGIKMMDYGSGINAGKDRPFIQDANPIQDNLLNTRNSEGFANFGSGFADITFVPGLVLTINGSYNLDDTRSKEVLNKYYGQFDSTGGTVSMEHNRTFSYNVQQLLNYTHTFAELHNLNVMLGHEYYDYSYRTLYASKSKMFSDDNQELNGSVVDGKSSGSYKNRYNNEGYLGRVQYDYDGKYFGSASYRRDASSRFATDSRWGSFWSLGGAWIISKEKFYDINWMDMLKLKASIGSQGNDNIGSYQYSDQYTISNSNGEVGTAFAGKGNKDITWETQTNFNAGVEFTLFGRLTGSLEYYRRTTTDMLMRFSTAPSIGYSSYYKNVGDLYNTGFELDLQANILRKKDISWDAHLNISSIKNQISRLDDANKTSSYYTADGKKVSGFTSGSFFIAEGQSIYTWRIREWAGVDPETGKAQWWKNTYLMDSAGENYVDANGNVVKEADKVWTGREKTTTYSEADYYVTEQTTVPKFQGGFGTTFRAYGFDLSINCSFQLGGKAYDSTYAYFMSNPTSASGGYAYHKDLADAWTPENANSSIPRFMYGSTDQYSASSSTRFLTNSSYLNIENINLGYTFPAKWTKAALINNLRVYLACENLGYFSARKGFDPRQSYSDSSNVTRYSPMRTISGGITVQF